jgi:molybdopterin converting factor small subunit
MQVLFKDETFAGKILDEILIQIEQECLSIAELIRLKVSHEVSRFNVELEKDNQAYSHQTELKLNGQDALARRLKNKQADIEQETYRAWEAFKHNTMVVLVDNRQVEGLDTEILLHKDTEVSFIHLTPLVGG